MKCNILEVVIGLLLVLDKLVLWVVLTVCLN